MSWAGMLFVFAFILSLMINLVPKFVIDHVASAAHQADLCRAEELGFDVTSKRTDELNWIFVELYEERKKYIYSASALLVLTCGWFAFSDGQFRKVDFWFSFLFLNLELAFLYHLMKFMIFRGRGDDHGTLFGGAPRSFRSMALSGCSGCIVWPVTLVMSWVATSVVIGAFSRLVRAIGFT